VTVRPVRSLLWVIAGLTLACLTFSQIAALGSPTRQSTASSGPSVVITAPSLDVTGILDSLRDPNRSPFPDQLLLVVLVFAIVSPKIGAGLLSGTGRLRLAPVGRQTPIRLRGPPAAG
jgi:hypothetical protein